MHPFVPLYCTHLVFSIIIDLSSVRLIAARQQQQQRVIMVMMGNCCSSLPLRPVVKITTQLDSWATTTFTTYYSNTRRETINTLFYYAPPIYT